MNIWLAIWAILDFASVNHEPPNPEIPEVVCEYFQEDCVRALGVAWCESLHNPRAYNGVDHGLFQINEHYWVMSLRSIGISVMRLFSQHGWLITYMRTLVGAGLCGLVGGTSDNQNMLKVRRN